MTSNEFNELLNSLKSSSIVTNQDTSDETLYVWKPVPIVSSPFQIEQTEPLIKEVLVTSVVPQISEAVIKNPSPIFVSPIQQQQTSIQAQPSQYNIPQSIVPLESYVSIPYEESKIPQSIISYGPPSTVYYQTLPQNNLPVQQISNNELLPTIKKDDKKFWFEWSMYIFGFSLMLFIIFFALWYFYVKDYNKKYPLEIIQNPQIPEKQFKIPPPSYLESKIIDNSTDFISSNFEKEDIHEAEKLIQEEFFKPDDIIDSLFDEKEKKKKKKLFFDLSDIDSSEFEVIQPKIINEGKLSDESDEVKKYAEKRAKLFQEN